ncbi:MAG: isopeptide-forming domain-containing fimbrial protein [Clostridia bacterium]|nr:isopeptide-forming domain-containing fimbrial protein [Clostridia bacterium]
MKKLFSIILVVLMAMTLAAPSFAANEGSITINNIGTDATYEIYKLLDLESYDKTSGLYSYKVDNDWTGFFATTEAKAYITVDDAGYATWVNGEDDDSIAAFAKLALAYAKANSIDPVKSSENAGEFVITESSGKFSDLELGYYLVDSTLGALCGLTTTNPAASINAKNYKPTIDKQVQEDSTEQWGTDNTADIGQTVCYRVTINVHAGAENYILHDKMSAGLTFKSVSGIEHIKTGEGTTVNAVLGTDYTVWTQAGITTSTDDDVTDDCTFEVRFSKDFCDGLETNDKIIISYEAMLNRNAIVANDGNPNEAWLDYGEGNATTHDTVYTKTFGFDLIKTDSQNTLIDGAQFKIYDAATGGNEVAVVLLATGGGGEKTYRRARADEPGSPIEVVNGKARLVGFDNGTYYLEETVAPTGYNKLTTRTKFIISDGNLDSIFNDGIYSSGSGVHVVNKTGSMLPETGGFGTNMLIVFGGIVVLMTGDLLFAKKRMSQIAE